MRILNSEQKEAEVKTKIEPNPTQQCIWITVPNDFYKVYKILNTKGQEVDVINVPDNENKLRYCFQERVSDTNLLLIGKDEGGNILDVNKVIIIK
ncbi:MAG: hypothetical protein IPK10_19480 [Bacteroidetes bacterium]|nr:hypothetical protein [Bacteroidota bacterium]